MANKKSVPEGAGPVVAGLALICLVLLGCGIASALRWLLSVAVLMAAVAVVCAAYVWLQDYLCRVKPSEPDHVAGPRGGLESTRLIACKDGSFKTVKVPRGKGPWLSIVDEE